MPFILIILGLLLMLFGGGCTIVFAFVGIPFSISEGAGAWNEFIPLWLLGGVAPLIGGFFLFRHGQKIDRERRQRGMAPTKPPEQG